MVLIRLAYASTLPAPADLVRRLADGVSGGRRDAGAATATAAADAGSTGAAAAQ